MDTVIVGSGAAGIGAAITSAKNGLKTLIIDSESTIGGDLFSGLPIYGAYTSLGKPCAGEILDEIIDCYKNIAPDSYIGPVCDWRTVYGLCLDPVILYHAVIQLLKKYGVRLWLNATVFDVSMKDGYVKSLSVATRNKTQSIDCTTVIDASGDASITRMSGGEVLYGNQKGNFQPVSLNFRVANVGYEPLLKFIMDNPDEALLCENPVLPKDRETAVKKLYDAGYPYVAISSNGKVVGEAIKEGEIHPCTAAFINPTSVQRKEVCINATRIGGIDCSDNEIVSGALYELSEQMLNIVKFLKKTVPGFENSFISSIAHRIGVRETGRIKGEYILKQNDVINAVKHEDCIARGCHHVDIHGEGTCQVRIPVKDGGSYDIPYRSLLPVGLSNVIAAGRCISSDRGANGSARVMGTCLSTGQAAGKAAAAFVKEGHSDFRSVDII